MYKASYWASVGLCAVAMLFIVVDLVVLKGNRQMQEQFGSRQSEINVALNLSKVNQELVQALAELASKNNDIGIKRLLAENGITIQPSEETKQATAPAGAQPAQASKQPAKQPVRSTN